MPSRLESPDRSRQGFTPLPHAVLDGLLCLPLTRRELSVLLLVARLTYGCRNAPWARLRQANLAVVGIGPGHARQVLDELLRRGLLERREARAEYRVGTAIGMVEAERAARLERLVATQVSGSSQYGNFPGRSVTETVRRTLPKGELPPSRNGNTSTVPAWRFDRSQGRFLNEMVASIDKDKY